MTGAAREEVARPLAENRRLRELLSAQEISVAVQFSAAGDP